MSKAVEKLNVFGVEEYRVYTTKSRGTKMTLSWDFDNQEWTMCGVNAASRAYGTLGSYKAFASLEDVEKAYKGWVGIAAFDAAIETQAVLAKIRHKAKVTFLEMNPKL